MGLGKKIIGLFFLFIGWTFHTALHSSPFHQGLARLLHLWETLRIPGMEPGRCWGRVMLRVVVEGELERAVPAQKDEAGRRVQVSQLSVGTSALKWEEGFCSLSFFFFFSILIFILWLFVASL